MSYDPSTHIVSAPVEIADIQSAIGSDSDNLYTLSVNPNINKWAKYKPVQLNQNFVNDQLKADLTWKDDATWWKAQDGKCGLSYLTFGTATLVKAAIDNKTTVWSHVAPTSHVRQTDFNQYDHLAIPPVFNVGSTSARLAAGSTLDILIATSTSTGLNLRLSDFRAFENYYYSVLIFDGNGNLKMIHSGDKPLADYTEEEDVEMSIPFTSERGGYSGVFSENQTYYIYPVITDRQYYCAYSEYGGAKIYIPLPSGADDYGMQPCSFLAKAYTQWASINAFVFGQGRIVTWTVAVYGAGSPTSASLSLIDAQGNTVTADGKLQEVELNFSTGAQKKNGTTYSSTVEDVTAGDGTTGRQMKNRFQTSLTLPTNNPELYRVKYVSLNIEAIAGIGHDIDPNV
jgi:hypothetical protein